MKCCQCENVASSNVASSQLGKDAIGKEEWKAEKKVGEVKNGEIAAIGEFEVAIPVSDKPVKYLLRASFVGGAVKAENEWEVYAFPKNSTFSTRPNSQNVRVVSNISRDDLLAAMARGERVNFSAIWRS